MTPSANLPVFLILAHADPKHFKRLASRLGGVGRLIAHVDLKTASDPFAHPDVTFVSKRYNVRWAGFSMVLATLELLRLGHSMYPSASHYVLLSGADYPLVSNDALSEFFRNATGHSHIRFFDVRKSSIHYQRMATRYSFRDAFGTRGEHLILRVARKGIETALVPFRKTFPTSLVLCYGSSWWSLTPECVSYVLYKVKQNSFWLDYWRFVASPDEQFFHTLIANSPYLEKTDGFSPFQGRGLWRVANLHHIHSSLNKVYTEEDMDEVAGSSKLFIRKVASDRSSALLDVLDRRSR